MLTVEELQQRHQAGEHFEFLCFWGHQPRRDGNVSKSCFSQWFAAPFTVDGLVYPTAEHWMMASKARLFHDFAVADDILASPDPKQAKELGRTVSNFESSVWDTAALDLVTQGNLEKFRQNVTLGNFLRATGDAVLVEASPYDRIWGIGLKEDDVDAENPSRWLGKNWLGFVLMEVRDRLQGEMSGCPETRQ